MYRARDTKLDRDVAIKVLREEFANDEERLSRFEREAKLLASLNHPNLASIHGFEESDRVKALVLELVEGLTLAERIEHGRVPVDEAIALAKQIADALEAGHEAGVIHRDLKPDPPRLFKDTPARQNVGDSLVAGAIPKVRHHAGSPRPYQRLGINISTQQSLRVLKNPPQFWRNNGGTS